MTLFSFRGREAEANCSLQTTQFSGHGRWDLAWRYKCAEFYEEQMSYEMDLLVREKILILSPYGSMMYRAMG